MIDRFGVLRQFPWPTFTAAGVAGGIRWLMVIVAAVLVAWLVFVLTQRSAGARSEEAPVGADK